MPRPYLGTADKKYGMLSLSHNLGKQSDLDN